MLKKIILSTVVATATLTVAEPVFAAGDLSGCSLPAAFAHLCVANPPASPTQVPEPSLIVSSIVVAGGLMTKKMAQHRRQATAK